MPTPTLADLAKAPERKVFEAAAAALKADSIIGAVFHPIRQLETPKYEAFLSYGVYEMVVQPGVAKLDDKPMRRETVRLPVWISAYLPWEPREEDSRLVGLDLGNRIRTLFWGKTFMDPGNPGIGMNVATTSFRFLELLAPKDGATRILTWEVMFEIDINPTTGAFA